MPGSADNDYLIFVRTIGRLEEGLKHLETEMEAVRGDLKTANERLNDLGKALSAITTGHRLLWGLATIAGGLALALATLFSGVFDKLGGPR